MRVGPAASLLCLTALTMSGPDLASGFAQELQISDVVDRVRAAPPEVLSDLFLELLENGRVQDPELRSGMLDDLWVSSFRIAAPAPGEVFHPSGSVPVDADPLNMTGGLRLDRQNVRVRTLRLMLARDPERARDAFVQWEPFEFPAEDCGAAVLPDVTGYYELAGELYERGFTDGQRAELRHERFLEEILLRVNSPLELAPAASMIAGLPLNPAQRRHFVGLFAERLGTVKGGNRAFYIAVRRQQLMARVRALLETHPSREPAAHALAFALRTFLAAHLAAPRCLDIAELEEHFRVFREDTERLEKLRADPKIQVIIREDPARDFNEGLLAVLAVREFVLDPLPLLIEPEKTVEGIEAADPPPGASTPFWERYRKLAQSRPGGDGGQEPDSSVLWRREFDELLDLAPDGAADKEHSALYAFTRVAGAYGGLADLALNPAQAEAAARRWVELLCDSELQHSHPALWLAHVKRLVSRSRPLSVDARKDVQVRLAGGMSIPGVNPLVPTALRQSLLAARNPVVALYGLVEQTFPEQRRDWR